MLERVTNARLSAKMLATIAALAIMATAITFTACSEDKGVTALSKPPHANVSPFGNQAVRGGITVDEPLNRVNSAVGAWTLGDGSQVEVTDVFDSPDSLILRLNAQNGPGSSPVFWIRVPRSLSGAVVTDFKGKELFRYSYDLSANGDLRYEARSAQGVITTEYRNSGSVTLSVSDPTTSISVDFISRAEYENGAAMYGAYIGDPSTMNNLSEADRLTLEKFIYFGDSVNALSAPPAEAELVVQLLANSEFISSLMDTNGEYAPTNRLACDIASLVSTITCPLAPSGWAILVCIPSLGISVACSIAGIAQAIAD